MAGKVTYLHGPYPGSMSDAAGGWATPLSVTRATWGAIEKALGRVLTDPEREHVHSTLRMHRHFLIVAREGATSAQDQKRTLAAMIALPMAEKAAAWGNMDETTYALIEEELYRAGARTGADFMHATPEALHAATMAARANFRKSKGGAPRDAPRMLARAGLQLWRDLGGKPYAPAAKNDFATPMARFEAIMFKVAKVQRSPLAGRRIYATPLVWFVVALFKAIDPNLPCSPSAIAEVLREVREG